MAKKLLIVEDDISLQETLKGLLQNEGFWIEVASTGGEALAKIQKERPGLVLLDLGLPDIQGESVLKIIREEYQGLPVVILTAKSRPEEVAKGLNLGADDYLAKPFAAEELLARINARLKSSNNINLEVGDLKLDMAKMSAIREGVSIDLTKTEFELLKYLLENKGRIVTREMILNNVWGYSKEVESRVVDIYIGYLRKKVDHGFKQKLIKNKRGFGYMIDI